MPGIADDIFAGPVAPSAPNAMRLALPDGVTPSVSVNAGPYVALGAGAGVGGGGSMLTYLVDAGKALGRNDLSHFYDEFIDQSDMNIIQTAGGTVGTLGDGTDSVNSIGGVVSMTTSVAPTGQSRFIPPNTGTFPPMCSFNNPNIKFYRAMRFRMVTAPTADTFCWAGSQGFNAGVHGANSTTKYSLRVRSPSVGTPTYVTSTVGIDTAFHVIRSWHDGVKAWLAVDGETPIGVNDFALWPISNSTESMYDVTCGKLGNAVDHQMMLDWALWAVAPT